ncbi:MAG: IS481 family transposase [Pseudonocardiaceae bacterium]
MKVFIMDLARYAVDAVVLEGRSLRAVAGALGMSKSWVADQVGLCKAGGYDNLAKRSTAPHSRPTQTCTQLEDEIVLLRKQLVEQGLDGGAKTIAYHLKQRHDQETVPSVSTVWRILARRGFIVAQPQKRPKKSWIRFESSLPNETWQSDMTHWRLANGTGVEIIHFIDDYSRMVLASRVLAVTTTADVVALFYQATYQWGFPVSVLTDNGCIYTASYRNGRCGFETELATLGIKAKHGKPYHPQTQGKIERFHKTLKRWLTKQPHAETITDLQKQVDWFCRYYNEIRPHSARDMTPPRQAFNARDKATPTTKKLDLPPHTRVRHDKIDKTGTFTLRHNTKLHHIAIGRAHKGRKIIILIADLDIRVLSDKGELLRHLTLDPTKNYQPIN